VGFRHDLCISPDFGYKTSEVFSEAWEHPTILSHSTDTPDGELLLSVMLPPVPRAVAEARRAVESSCPIREPCCWALILMVSEMATNAVKHAATDFRVELRRNRNGFRLAVTDFAPGQRPQLRVPDDPLQVGGRGIGIVNELADRWGVDEFDDRKSVWLFLECDPGAVTVPG